MDWDAKETTLKLIAAYFFYCYSETAGLPGIRFIKNYYLKKPNGWLDWHPVKDSNLKYKTTKKNAKFYYQKNMSQKR